MEIINNTPSSKTRGKKINLEDWSKLVNEWKKGTESQKDFCARLNLNINSFTYAKAKLSTKDKQKKFIPLTIHSDTPPKIHANIILENTKGMKLHIPVSLLNEETMHLLKMAGW